MNPGCRVGLILLLSFCAVSLLPAQAEKSETVPLPLIEPQVLKPSRPLQPGSLTAGEKAELTLRNFISGKTFLNRLGWASINQLRDHPDPWDEDAAGFGQRLAHRYGRTAVRGSVELGLDIAFKTDPRYDRCLCTGFFPRAGHALKRTVTSRRDQGGEMVSAAKIGGAYITPMVSNMWYPVRTNLFSYQLESGSIYLLWQANLNLLREFWPEIKRRVFRR